MTDLIELTKADEDMEGFSFLIRAMVKENYTNKNFCSDLCIKITKDGEAVSTDKRRIHLYNLKETYSPGVYRVLKRLKTHIAMIKEVEADYKKPFPEWTEIFPLSHGKDVKDFEGSFPNSDPGFTPSLTRVIRELPGFQTINPAFLKDLDDHFHVTIDNTKKGILFVSNGKKAFITTIEYQDDLL